MPHKSKYDLGQKVEYIHVGPDNDVKTGTGHVVANLIGPGERPIVQVKDGDKAFNLEEAALNLDEAGRVKYLDHVKKVQAKVKEHNDTIQNHVDASNKAIDEMNEAEFGPPVKAEE